MGDGGQKGDQIRIYLQRCVFCGEMFVVGDE